MYQNFVAKLLDFGLARLGPPVDKSHVTTQAVGTYGYAAPEYINTGKLMFTYSDTIRLHNMNLIYLKLLEIMCHEHGHFLHLITVYTF